MIGCAPYVLTNWLKLVTRVGMLMSPEAATPMNAATFVAAGWIGSARANSSMYTPGYEV